MMYEEYKKKFIKEISNISYRYNVRDVFSDFCNVFAISLQNAVWFSEKKEQEYIKTMSRYSKEEQEKLINLGCYVILGLESKMGDFLGECFEELSMNDKKYKGQCFTPYHVGLLMADMTYSKEHIEELYKDKEITSLQDCCCGGGCLLISACDVLKQRNLNYQEKVYIWANDIDSLCIRMCYIQLSLIGAMAKVTCGDALKMEYIEEWHTPMYVMNYNKIVRNITEREENSKNKLKITKILPNGNNLIKEDIMLNKKEVERYTITGRDNMNLELIAGRNRQLQNIKRFMYSKDYTTFEKKNKKLRKQNQLMKKALEQYANPFYEEQPINQLAITTLKKIRGIK